MKIAPLIGVKEGANKGHLVTTDQNEDDYQVAKDSLSTTNKLVMATTRKVFGGRSFFHHFHDAGSVFFRPQQYTKSYLEDLGTVLREGM